MPLKNEIPHWLGATIMGLFLFLFLGISLEKFQPISQKEKTQVVEETQLLSISKKDQTIKKKQEKNNDDHWNDKNINFNWEDFLDTKRMKKLKFWAMKRRVEVSQGYCMRWVKKAIWNSFLPKLENNLISRRPWLSAEDFRVWASEDSKRLCHELKLAEAKNLEINDGFVLLYKKGSCGFHEDYGHIEVVVDSLKKEACSDHCRSYGTCKPDLILVPVHTCSWVYGLKKKSQKNYL